MHSFAAPMDPWTRRQLVASGPRRAQPGRVPYYDVWPAFPDRNFGSPITEAGPKPSEEGSLSKLAEQYGPAAASLLLALDRTDPERDFHVYEARVLNLRDLYDRAPGIAKPMLQRRLRIAEAKLQAAKKSRTILHEEQASTRAWRALGFTASTTGILVGFGLLALMISGAAALASKRR